VDADGKAHVMRRWSGHNSPELSHDCGHPPCPMPHIVAYWWRRVHRSAGNLGRGLRALARGSGEVT